MPQVRRWVGRLLLAAVSVGVTLGATEWALAKLGIAPHPSLYVDADDYLLSVEAAGRELVGELPPGHLFRRLKPGAPALATPDNRFPVPKPEGTIRIFAFGGSTTLGCPISLAGGSQNDISFPTWLGLRLRERYPGRDIEVLNCGDGGQNLQRVHEYALECLDYEPDAFVVYSGQNEYLPHSLLSARAGDMALALPRSGVSRTTRLGRLWSQFLASINERRYPEVGTKDFVVPEQLITAPYHTQRDTELIEQRYRELLIDLAERCRASGVELFLATLISNVRDFEPNASWLADGVDVSDAEVSAWEKSIAAARAALADGRAEVALATLDKLPPAAAALAEVQFRRAQALESVDRRDDAWVAYGKARDADSVQRRATGALSAIVRDVCRETDAVLVDVEQFVREARGGLAPGNDLFYDNCHPNFEGTDLLLRALEPAMVEAGFIAPTASPVPQRPPWETELKALGFEKKLMAFLYADVCRSYGALVLCRSYDPSERLRVARELFAQVPERFPFYAQGQLLLGCVEMIAGEETSARARFDACQMPRKKAERFIADFARRCNSTRIHEIFRESGLLPNDSPH